jgi:serine phosphatase RsbU (regulator of sigma subunit)/putative methionine-R-sulfoxide reductase with GAF domain
MQETLVHNDTLEIDNLNKEAWSINRKDAYKSIELSSQALEKSQKINYKKGIALAYKTLGTASIWISKNEEALRNCFDAITIFKEIGDKVNEAETNYYVGASFSYVSDYPSAIKYYNECYNINRSNDNEIGMADGLNGLGTVYYSIEQNEKALEVLLESQKLCIKHNNTEIYVKVLDGIGETYHNLKQYDLALEYYTKCASICEENGIKQSAAFALDGLGRTYTATKKYDVAIIKFNESLAIRRELGFKRGEVVTLYNIGCLLIDKKDVQEGINYLEQSFKLSESINSKEGIYKASEKLAELYESLKRFEEAIKYYKIFQISKEEVRNEKTTQLVKSTELQHKVLQSQAEKLLLEEKANELETYSDNLVLISNIGQQIISQLSVATIVDTVYGHVNDLMDATGFGIGLFESDENRVVYPLYIEGEEKFKNVVYDLKDENRLTALCFNKRKEIVINNYEIDFPKYVKSNQKPLAGKSVESLVYLPLVFKDKALGVITVQSFKPNAYTTYHINILRNLASYATIALENAQLYELQEKIIFARTKEVLIQKEEIEKAYQNSKLLSEVGQQITSTLNFEEIFEKLHHYVEQVMDAGCFGVRLYDPVRKVVDYKYGIERGVKYQSIASISMDDDDNYSVWCIKNRKEIFLNDNLVEYSKYVKQIRVVSGDLPHSLIFYPIMIGERVLGVITIQSFEKFAYKPQHLDILKSLASYVAIALDNASLYENLEEKVKERTEEVISQKAIIEEKNKDITDSIKYAKKIQLALMPDTNLLKKAFTESFVYYRPKDIVSGDFYWIDTFKDDITVFAAADCTGHGVPGAFMSLICNDLMGQVIKDQNVTSPAQVLTMLDERLRAMLNKSTDHSSNDGMDIALCAYHPKNMILQFAGAHRPLLLIRNGELIEYKPSKHSIGGYVGGHKLFGDNVIQLQKGDSVYILTDGYSDQFGGQNGKKFKFKKLQKYILSISHTSMDEQHDLLEEAFISWRGRHEQVDDVCVIGVRV